MFLNSYGFFSHVLLSPSFTICSIGCHKALREEYNCRNYLLCQKRGSFLFKIGTRDRDDIFTAHVDLSELTSDRSICETPAVETPSCSLPCTKISRRTARSGRSLRIPPSAGAALPMGSAPGGTVWSQRCSAIPAPTLPSPPYPRRSAAAWAGPGGTDRRNREKVSRSNRTSPWRGFRRS